MLIATGVLMNIPTDMLGAPPLTGIAVAGFIYIKRYLLSVRGPARFTDFVLQRQQLQRHLSAHAGRLYHQDQALASSAKEVDLLVTWLFRLTQEQYNYKMAAVSWHYGVHHLVPCVHAGMLPVPQ